MPKRMAGKRRWFFPDGDLPQPGDREPFGHESLIVLNPNPRESVLELTVYYPDRPPEIISGLTVGAERVRCFRLDKPLGERAYRIPFGQYALKVEATVPVICQIGRMDVSQPNLAYYTTLGYPG